MATYPQDGAILKRRDGTVLAAFRFDADQDGYTEINLVVFDTLEILDAVELADLWKLLGYGNSNLPLR